MKFAPYKNYLRSISSKHRLLCTVWPVFLAEFAFSNCRSNYTPLPVGVTCHCSWVRTSSDASTYKWSWKRSNIAAGRCRKANVVSIVLMGPSSEGSNRQACTADRSYEHCHRGRPKRTDVKTRKSNSISFYWRMNEEEFSNLLM